MSEERAAGFDVAIDGAVREMLDVEPPAELRGRVMQRIEAPGRSIFRRMIWVALPVATAAILVLALLLPLRRAQAPAPIVAHRPDVNLPVVTPTAPLHPAVAVASLHPRRAPEVSQIRGIVAATGADQEAAGAFQIAALEGPMPIDVKPLEIQGATPLGTVDVAPIRVPAIQVNALPDTPRERQPEE